MNKYFLDIESIVEDEIEKRCEAVRQDIATYMRNLLWPNGNWVGTDNINFSHIQAILARIEGKAGVAVDKPEEIGIRKEIMNFAIALEKRARESEQSNSWASKPEDITLYIDAALKHLAHVKDGFMITMSNNDVKDLGLITMMMYKITQTYLDKYAPRRIT